MNYGFTNPDETAGDCTEDDYERASAYMKRAQLEASQDVEEIYAIPGMAKINSTMLAFCNQGSLKKVFYLPT